MPQTKDSAETSKDESLSTPRLGRVPNDGNGHDREVRPHKDREGENGYEHGRVELSDLIRVAVTLVAAGFVWFRVWEPFPRVSLVGIAGVLFGGYPIWRVSDLPGGVPEYPRAPHDNGSLDDNRACRGALHR